MQVSERSQNISSFLIQYMHVVHVFIFNTKSHSCSLRMHVVNKVACVSNVFHVTSWAELHECHTIQISNHYHMHYLFLSKLMVSMAIA